MTNYPNRDCSEIGRIHILTWNYKLTEDKIR